MIETGGTSLKHDGDALAEQLAVSADGNAATTAVLASGHHATSENPAVCRPLLSVAPMMDWTDVHFRQLARLLSKRTWMWTEMVVDKTILYTQNLDKYLWFPPEQRPLVLQLGGSDPTTLAAAAAKAAEYGYDEINLNCGCPSDRVAGAGCFGAALMLQPKLVADCMAAMAVAVAAARHGGGGGGRAVPLTIKCRLGVDEADSYAQLHEFVRVVSEGSPVRHFVVHARKAFLNGLSPHQNRTVPPLRHQWAWALARDFPHLQFSLNGGLLNCHEARAAILTVHPEVPYSRPVLPLSDPFAAVAAVSGVTDRAGASTAGARQSIRPNEVEGDVAATVAVADAGCSSTNGGGIEGVMIGRGAYNDPWGCLADADRAVYGELYNAAPSRRWVIEQYREYAEPMVGRWFVKADGHADPSVRTLMRPLLNLFHGEPGCKRWKNAVDEVLKAGPRTLGEVLDRTLHLIPDHVLDAAPCQPDLATLPPFQLDPMLPGPTSRAGQNQAPPGSKPPRKTGKTSEGTDATGASAAGTGAQSSAADGADGDAATEFAVEEVEGHVLAAAASLGPCCGVHPSEDEDAGVARTAAEACIEHEGGGNGAAVGARADGLSATAEPAPEPAAVTAACPQGAVLLPRAAATAAATATGEGAACSVDGGAEELQEKEQEGETHGAQAGAGSRGGVRAGAVAGSPAPGHDRRTVVAAVAASVSGSPGEKKGMLGEQQAPRRRQRGCVVS